MRHGDMRDVLKIIQSHNPDDAECAAESYGRGLDGQFVLTHQNVIAGVTGAREISGTDRSYWLSWSYVDSSSRIRLSGGSSSDTILFELLYAQLQQANARKLFAMLSPNVDSPIGGGHSYGGAGRSYESFGFELELIHRDYYDRGEQMTVMSYRLQPRQPTGAVAPDMRSLVVFDADEISETDDAYYLEWEFSDFDDELGGLSVCLSEIRGWKGRVAFIGVPGFAIRAIEQLEGFGFREDGRLTDFIEDGIDEIRLRLDL